VLGGTLRSPASHARNGRGQYHKLFFASNDREGFRRGLGETGAWSCNYRSGAFGKD